MNLEFCMNDRNLKKDHYVQQRRHLFSFAFQILPFMTFKSLFQPIVMNYTTHYILPMTPFIHSLPFMKQEKTK